MRMRWAEYVVGGEVRNAYTIFVRMPKGMIIHIKINLEVIEFEDLNWIQLVHYKF
jgi:hypothetical protein